MVTLREKYTKMVPNAHKKVRQQRGDLHRTLKDKYTTKSIPLKRQVMENTNSKSVF